MQRSKLSNGYVKTKRTDPVVVSAVTKCGVGHIIKIKMIGYFTQFANHNSSLKISIANKIHEKIQIALNRCLIVFDCRSSKVKVIGGRNISKCSSELMFPYHYSNLKSAMTPKCND